MSYACLKALVSQLLNKSVSQSVSQSLENSIKLKIMFYSDLLKAFRVNLKACLGLVLPKQYCLIVVRENRKIEAGFWVMLFYGPYLLLCGSYYTVLSYCMICMPKSFDYE